MTTAATQDLEFGKLLANMFQDKNYKPKLNILSSNMSLKAKH